MKGGGYGWQTSLADLALILFLLSAAAVHVPPKDAAAPAASPTASSPPPSSPPASARSEPLAVYDAAPGAPPLGDWLAQQAADPRQQLTITVRYGPQGGAREAALREAARLLAEAGTAGRRARVVVEPGPGSDSGPESDAGPAPARAVLAYDAPNGTALAEQTGN